MNENTSTNLSCGIIGLPNVGKSTLFNILTKQRAASDNYPFCTIDPNIGIVEVYDERLDKLAKIYNSKKIIYTAVTFVDIAGIVKGASKGEGLGNKFLQNIRETDALVEVVRCFDDPNVTHVSGSIDPIEDIKTINIELILSDLEMITNIEKKLVKQARGNKKYEETLVVIEKIKKHLNDEAPVRSLTLSKEEKDLIKIYPFLTQKQLIYIANMNEEDLNNVDNNKSFKKIKDFANNENSQVIPICIKLEEEISKLEKEEAIEFLESLNIKETALDRLIYAAFKLLNLAVFLTTGEQETRAWTIKKSSTAYEAAGKIHTDIQKGFIKAEVVKYEDMLKYKGRIQARQNGACKIEGKNYNVQDGDVILFYHN